MGRGRRRRRDDDNGFSAWGGYFEAKKSKLVDQYQTGTVQQVEKQSDIFNGIAILVNGLTNPNAEDLKLLMAAHGGTYHTYQISSTTHIIASNLPNVKINKLGSVPIVKPSWIIDSIALEKLLDYRRYLLYTNQSTSQPRLEFPVVPKNEKLQPTDETHPAASVNLELPVAPKNEQQSPKHKPKVDKLPATCGRSAPTKTASDPQFLQEFYNNSRLHLISTLGAEYKQLVSRMRDESIGKYPGLERLLVANRPEDLDVSRTSSTHIIMHIDMDCFFVSVGLRSRPELRGKPVAVTHARNPHINATKDRSLEIAMNTERLPQRMELLDANSSMSEIASCSYEARKFGIRNGMFLGAAVKLCPDLKTIPYDFEGYKEVSNALYKTIASYTLDIEAVSCDEMYVDISGVLKTAGLSVEQWASHIRAEIESVTGCCCSTGFGANRLQARLATKKAKPHGQYYLKPEEVESHLFEIPLYDLPGVGRATVSKLANLGLNTCGDVQSASLSAIQTELGPKAGETLWEQARGIDRRALNFHHERKSVSAEVNYGIRFKTAEECYNFLDSLSVEVCSRLNEIKMRARCVTLKIMIRAADAPVETAKYLGHGICDCLSKSSATNGPVSEPKTIFKEAKTLYDKLNVNYEDLRGVGIQLTKLEKVAPINAAMSRFLQQNPKKNTQDADNKNEDNHLQQIADKSKDIPLTIMQKITPINATLTRFLQQNSSQVEKSRDNEVTTKPEKIVTKEITEITKPQKGRPKGSSGKSTAKAAVKEEMPLTKFFKATKEHVPVQAKAKVDLNVLMELPADVRQEVIKEYQLEDVLLHDQPKPSTSAEQVFLHSEKSPFDGLNWEQLKPVLKHWISSEKEPNKIDADMLGQHFKELAIGRQIELLKIAFNFLHRTFSKLNCKWHSAYFNIVNLTQEGMVAQYGNVLHVNRDFGCCHS